MEAEIIEPEDYNQTQKGSDDGALLNYWGFGLRASSGILKTTGEHNVSETGHKQIQFPKHCALLSDVKSSLKLVQYRSRQS
jgi:hypothetical protein